MEKPVKKTEPKKTRALVSSTPARLAAKPRAATVKLSAASAKPRVAARRGTTSTLAQGFELNHDVIAVHAYDLFERSGYSHGRDVEFWLEAERQVKLRRKT